MKFPSNRRFFTIAGPRRGAALVIVLSSLVLITVVVVAFMVASATERAASASYAEGGRARLLAQSALDLVQGQIWAATMEADSSWASQPGAIRTFRSDSTNFANVYKLYSSDVMVAPGGFNPGATNNPTEIPVDWASRTNQFVDLNRPVTNSAGWSFPIIDPRAKDVASPTNSVAGFDFNTSRGATATNLPMPVKWLYQMKDGSLGTMNDAGKIVPAPTISNPVVGRIAFWTDDDTTKININTAGEGVFWDIPRGAQAQGPVGNMAESERSFAGFQPAQREFQRYPGHPFQISLKTVFPDLLAEEIYALTPRVQSDDGGSNVSDPDPGNWRRPTGPMALKKERLYASLDEVLFKQTPLSGTRVINDPNDPGDPAFGVSPEKLGKLQFFVTSYNRAPEVNLLGKPRISMWPVNSDPDRRTAIDKWFARCATIGGRTYSIQRSNPTSPTSDFDNIADNQRLFTYIRAMASEKLPGYGASFFDKYGNDINQTLAQCFDYIRCINLVDTSAGAVPFGISNFGANLTSTTGFNSHYGFGQAAPLKLDGYRGLGRFTTISEIGFLVFPMTWNNHPRDYLNFTASQLNSWNTAQQPLYGPWPIPSLNGDPVRLGEVEWANPPIFRQQTNSSWGGTTRPIRTRTSSPALELNPNGIGDSNLRAEAWRGWGRLPENPPLYRLILLLEPVQPASGYVQYNADYIYVIKGLDQIQVDGKSIGFPNEVKQEVQGRAGMLGGTTDSIRTALLSAADGFINATGPRFTADTKNNQLTISTVRYYNLVSPPFPIDGSVVNGWFVPNSTFRLSSAGDITIQIQSRDGEPIQDLKFRVAGMTLPTPDPEEYRSITSGKSGQYFALGRRERLQWVQAGGGGEFFCPEDTVVSLESNGPFADVRLTMAAAEVASDKYVPHAGIDASTKRAHSFREGMNGVLDGSNPTFGRLVADLPLRSGFQPDIPSNLNGVFNALGLPGDFDTGPGQSSDGAFINKPDEGNLLYKGGSQLPYLSTGGWANQAALGFDTYFAPNRQVPSPGVFGSLPSRTLSGQPWETLLFNPNPAAGDLHRGFGTSRPDGLGFVNGRNPPDYLLLDLFNMPVVEPYAISEPFSTAGKINMNHQLVPFTYVTRTTALRAAFDANRVAAFHDADSLDYKNGSSEIFRHRINADETLKQWDRVFSGGGIFKSASEICAMDLYPVVSALNVPQNNPVVQPTYDANRAGIKNWWAVRRLTGDNMREQPYTNLYQNLTTQSNTYTIHVWAQAIKKSPQTPPDEIGRGDTITGEYRGSYSIERFIDPNNPSLPDFAQAGSPNTMGFYQFRVNQTQQFQP